MGEDVIRRPRKISNPPICHEEYESLGKDENKIRTRLITYQHPMIGQSPPMLDLRQWLDKKKNEDGSFYTGWSSNGVSLGLEDLIKLREICDKAIDAIQSMSK